MKTTLWLDADTILKWCGCAQELGVLVYAWGISMKHEPDTDEGAERRANTERLILDGPSPASLAVAGVLAAMMAKQGGLS